LLDFNKENFDELYKKTWNGKNEYFKPSRKNLAKRVTLIAKDEQSGIAKEIFFSTLERSIDIFLTRSFEDLITDAYLPRAILEQRRLQSTAGYMMEEQSKTDTTDPSTTTTTNNVNNTQHFK
jgi:hypothetical protein